MQKLYEKRIEYGMCDTNAKLKYAETLKLVEASVASYFKLYQKDNITLKKVYNAFWMFTKTKLEIEEVPSWEEEIILEAQLVQVTKILCVVEIWIHKKDSLKGIHAFVECVAASLLTRKIIRLSAIDFSIPLENEKNIEYSRWDIVCAEEKTLVVTSSFIDYSRHVNNAEYLRMILDCFSVDELEKMKIKEIELHYLKEAKEKDALTIKKSYTNHTWYFQIVKDVIVLEAYLKEE